MGQTGAKTRLDQKQGIDQSQPETCERLCSYQYVGEHLSCASPRATLLVHSRVSSTSACRLRLSPARSLLPLGYTVHCTCTPPDGKLLVLQTSCEWLLAVLLFAGM